MASTWLAAAFILGLLAWRAGLPPLVGFLASGFALSAFGVESPPALDMVAHAGVLLLLFAVGLKLRLKTMLRYEVWGTAVVHMVLFSAVLTGLTVSAGGLAWYPAATLALALSFSSTVFAAEALENQRELRSVHGRVAIGILILQDLAAVALLATVGTSYPSPYALLLLALPLARPLLGKFLDLVGHGELLVLCGATLALTVGGEGFARVGLSPELGALILGALLADHPRAQELSNALWSLKEVLLVGFFLSIGLTGAPSWQTLQHAALLLLLLPLKSLLFFVLMLAFGWRARTSLLTALNLGTFSEFGLIVASLAVGGGLLEEQWLVTAGVTVALSFAVAAPFSFRTHGIYERTRHWLERLERDRRHPDDEPITFGQAEVLVVGMGRVGTGAYDYIRAQGKNVVGIDSDAAKLERHLRDSRRVAYADAEDVTFWSNLKLDRLQAIMLAVPDVNAKLIACRELRRRGFRGLVSATHVYPEELEPLLQAGCDVSYNYFSEAGVGFARHTFETLIGSERGPAERRAVGS